MSASQKNQDRISSTARRLNGLLARMQRMFSLRRRKRKWVVVIVNPAAGQSSPDLKTLNRIIQTAGMDWEVEVTNSFGDGARLASRAVAAGASIVAACGGDGTVIDVASGLLGSDVPMAILPGGTGNALAKDLSIPLDLDSACGLMVDIGAGTRRIDLGVAGDDLFLLRLGVGLEAEITHTADREMKDRLGSLAYVAATFQAWGSTPVSHYRLEMAEEAVEIDGLACMVANAASLGIPGLTLSQHVSVDDGLLDVFVIRKADLGELTRLAASVVGAAAPDIGLPHWQTRGLTIHADPPQGVEADGEELGTTPVHVSVIPGAVKVIVPQ